MRGFLIRPNSNIFSPDQWNVVPDHELESLDTTSYNHFCPDWNTKQRFIKFLQIEISDWSGGFLSSRWAPGSKNLRIAEVGYYEEVAARFSVVSPRVKNFGHFRPCSTLNGVFWRMDTFVVGGWERSIYSTAILIFFLDLARPFSSSVCEFILFE